MGVGPCELPRVQYLLLGAGQHEPAGRTGALTKTAPDQVFRARTSSAYCLPNNSAL